MNKPRQEQMTPDGLLRRNGLEDPPDFQSRGAVLSILRNAPYGVAWLDNELKISWVNPFFVLLLGRDADTYQNRHFRSIILADDVRAFDELLGQIRTSVFPFGWLDLRMHSPDGRVIWVGLNLTRPSEDIPGYVATILDIGERKAGEHQLRQLRESINEIRQIARIGQLSYLPDRNLIRISAELMRLLDIGAGFTECALERFFDLFHPLDRSDLVEIFKTLPADHDFDLELTRNDGRLRHYRCFGQWIPDDFGGRQWRLTAQDITNWWESELRFRGVFYDNQLPLLLVNLDDESINTVNAAAEAFYGYPGGELQRMKLSDLLEAPSEGPLLISDEIYLRSRHRLASGVVRDVMMAPSRLRRMDENLAFLFVADLTDRIQSEAALSELNRSLEQRVEIEVRKVREQEQKLSHQGRLAALGEMASGIAHEINQPLNTISVTLDNLLSEISGNHPSVFVKEKSEKIFQSIMRLRGFIDHIRVFSRAQESPIHEAFRPKDSLDNTLAIVSHRLKRESIDLRLELEHIAGVKGNPYKFEQVLMNLFSNAIDALLTKNGPGEMRIEVRTRMEADRVILEIEDNGDGIEPRHLPHVMEPFYTTKETDRGTGLGLSISYGVITEMGGKIEIYSRWRHWTLVRIELPAATEALNETTD
jgi:PAS domain S-box-containing protein